ncbi:MAG: hypothetical protein AAGF53_19330 [Pseudomonadota bacterium]
MVAASGHAASIVLATPGLTGSAVSVAADFAVGVSAVAVSVVEGSVATKSKPETLDIT